MTDDMELLWNVVLDHPVRPLSRWGHGRPSHPQLAALIAAGRARYKQMLEGCLAWSEAFDAIPPGFIHQTQPYWGCGWLSPLDLMVLYSLVASNRPKQYLEVGSGCSTKFARRAIEDNHLDTRITSIDPKPRSSIDTICDEVKRVPLEEVDLTIFDQLSEGDLVFIDGSHRSFMNSDATVAVLEVLPRLKPGVIVGFDDIYLPDDYPPNWSHRFYSEQYLLAGWLLGGCSGLEIISPHAFAVQDAELATVVNRLLDKPIFSGLSTGGNSFWMKKTSQDNKPHA